MESRRTERGLGFEVNGEAAQRCWLGRCEGEEFEPRRASDSRTRRHRVVQCFAIRTPFVRIGRGYRRRSAGHAVASRQFRALRGVSSAGSISIFGAREEMQLLARACGGDVKDAAHFLRLAFAMKPVDPELVPRCVGALGLERRDEEFGDLAGIDRARRRPRSSQESRLLRVVKPLRACKSGTITTSNSRPLDLWMVISWMPQSGSAFGSGMAVRFSRAAIERGADEVLCAVGQGIEAAPEQVEIRACGIASTQAAPPRRSQTCSSHVPEREGGLKMRRCRRAEMVESQEAFDGARANAGAEKAEPFGACTAEWGA